MRVRLFALATVATMALAGCTSLDGPAATGPSTTTTGGRTNADGSPATGTTGTTTGLVIPVQVLDVAATPPVVDAGDTLTLRAVGKNPGTRPQDIAIEFLVAGHVVGTANAQLQPGESLLLATPYRATKVGVLPLEARIASTTDSVKGILTVHGPELADARIDIVPLDQCDRVTYRLAFANTGDGTASDIQIEARLLDDTGGVADTLRLTTPDVEAGKTTLVEITHVVVARCPTPKTYTASVTVTPQTGIELTVTKGPFTA